jgi:hypothetical protein
MGLGFKAFQKKINAVVMSFWRRCCGLTLEGHVRNDIIRQIMETEVKPTDTIEANQLKWHGHMKRMEEDRLPKQIYNGLQLKGKREEGREILGRRRQNKQWME